MNNLIRFGSVLFGLGMAAFGIENFVYGDGVFGLEPVPRWIPMPQVWAYLSGLVLLASGTGLAVNRRAPLAATALACLLGVWVLMLQGPRLLVAPHDGGRWTTTAETVALCTAAWILAAALTTRIDVGGRPSNGLLDTIAAVARFSYAGCFLVFGILHFIYHDYVASVIPGWIPGHVAWTYVTALAFFAAGASIATGIWNRLAATLLGIMFGTWVLILHAPRVAGARSRPEWTSLLIALAMSGGAWIVAGTSRPGTRRT
jgi:uncharacterized membrane protein